MTDKKRNLIIVISLALFWLALAVAAWLAPPQQISYSERRLLRQLPSPELKTVKSAQFMRDFADYTQDQFPARDSFRTLKAVTRVYLLGQSDNNDIYVADGYAAKLDYSLNEKSIKNATDRFRWLYDTYLAAQDIHPYIAVIPDKDYFLAAPNHIPSIDYERLCQLVKEGTDFSDYIDIAPLLSSEDYYKTDLHWKQENILPVAEKIATDLGVADRLTNEFTKHESDTVFRGAYAGQSALPLAPDRIVYLTSNITEHSSVLKPDTEETSPVYNLDLLKGRDPYDVYLSGAQPLIEITNPTAQSERELIIFRDSFGSSLAPLLLDAYSKITLIDIRYMSSEMVGDYITFQDQDVLFLYNTLILNSSAMLR